MIPAFIILLLLILGLVIVLFVRAYATQKIVDAELIKHQIATSTAKKRK